MSDPFGLAIYEYHNGEQTEVHKKFGCKTWFSDYEDWFSREKKAINLVKGNVLDIGCAAGRHSIYLQNEGLNVIGIDNSPLAIKTSKKRGLRKAKVQCINNLDSSLGIFDTILMFGNNFGLVGTPDNCKSIFKNFINLTNEDSIILAGSGDIHQTKNVNLIKIIKTNIENNKYPGEWEHVIKFKNQTVKVPWLYASKNEMKQLLIDTGWKVKRFIDDDQYDGAFIGIIV